MNTQKPCLKHQPPRIGTELLECTAKVQPEEVSIVTTSFTFPRRFLANIWLKTKSSAVLHSFKYFSLYDKKKKK
jgi:hypothetical protein